jgi:hypothetical protein
MSNLGAKRVAAVLHGGHCARGLWYYSCLALPQRRVSKACIGQGLCACVYAQDGGYATGSVRIQKHCQTGVRMYASVYLHTAQRCVLVVHMQLSNAIRVCEVPCGVGNVLANKGTRHNTQDWEAYSDTFIGAVAACVQLEDVKMVYVCAHLAAHTRNVRQRNSDYWRIAKEVRRDKT